MGLMQVPQQEKFYVEAVAAFGHCSVQDMHGDNIARSRAASGSAEVQQELVPASPTTRCSTRPLDGDGSQDEVLLGLSCSKLSLVAGKPVSPSPTE